MPVTDRSFHDAECRASDQAQRDRDQEKRAELIARNRSIHDSLAELAQRLDRIRDLQRQIEERRVLLGAPRDPDYDRKVKRYALDMLAQLDVMMQVARLGESDET